MPTGIYQRTKRHNQAISNSKKGLYKILTKKYLRREYIEKNLSTSKIAKNLNISGRSVIIYLHKYNIVLKPAHSYKVFDYSLELIKCYYWDEYLNIRQIAEVVGCTPQHMHWLMQKYNIKRRTRSESKIGTLNPMFGRIERLHHNYIPGLDRNYPLKFNKYIKETIRKRDYFTCQYCGAKQSKLNEKLHVHHIDYVKENLYPHNLISLCRSCHTTSNFNRDYWFAYYTYIIENIKQT